MPRPRYDETHYYLIAHAARDEEFINGKRGIPYFQIEYYIGSIHAFMEPDFNTVEEGIAALVKCMKEYVRETKFFIRPFGCLPIEIDTPDVEQIKAAWAATLLMGSDND